MNAYKSVFRAEISDHIAMRSSIYSERRQGRVIFFSNNNLSQIMAII